MNEEYHPEFSSACLKNGCTFCKINKNLSERIARFTKKDTTPLKRTKNNRWTGWNDKRRAKVLGIKI